MNRTKVTKDKVFETIVSAVNEIVDIIRLTYGPGANKALISKMPYFMVVDDGVQIARDLEFDDPYKNAILKLVRETAIRTNDRVGDGTTGAMIMLQAIINEVARMSSFNGYKIEEELKKGFEEVKQQLLSAKKIIKSKEELKKVALISFNNEKIAEMIANLYFELGKDAVITIDKSPTMETYVEVTNGVKIDNGYISPYMVTNPDRMEAVIDKPLILITDYRLTEASDILPILEKMAKANKNKLIIIAENIEQHALATLLVNHPHIINPTTNKPGVILSVAINAPKGENQKVFLEDLAMLVGARVFSSSKGDRLETADIKDLGQCDKFISRQDESIVVGPRGDSKVIKNAINDLKKAIETEPVQKKKDYLKTRLGFFTGSLAVIKVGAPTDNEQKALKYKVEDAVHATQSAFRNGVVCGGGLSLMRINTSSDILNEALKYPAKQLCENMGFTQPKEYFSEKKAWNLITGQHGEFLDVGVADPVDVLIAGVESAVSIASILVTTKALLVEYNDNSKE